MRQYITATGLVETDLQGFSLLTTIVEAPIPGILTLDTLAMMEEIVDHPNTYFRHPDLPYNAIREMFTIDQPVNGYNDGFLNDVASFSSIYEHAERVVIILSYKEQDRGRLGITYNTVPRSEMEAFIRNGIIDDMLKTL